MSLPVRTPHQECSDRKHLPGGGTSTESSYRAALGAGEQSRELPSLSSTGRAAAAGFPGITQNKGSPKAVPTFQAEQALGAASCSPWKCPGGENPPGVQPEATGSTGDTHRTCPGFGHTGVAPEGTEAQQPQSHPNPFCFPVPRPGSTLGSSSGCTAQAPQPQQHFHGARDGFGMSKNAKEHKPMGLPVPLSKGSSDIHLGEEPLTTAIPKGWVPSKAPGTGPAATQTPQRDPWRGQGTPGGDRALCCPTGTEPSSSSAPQTPPVCPRGSHLAPRSSTDSVSSSQRCETHQEFIMTWENKFHHSQRMLHTCPDTALQDSFPFACFP